MKTLIAELFSNGGLSKLFWTFLFSIIIGGTGWLSTLFMQVQGIDAKQKVFEVRQKDIKEDIKDIKADLKDIKEVLYKIAAKK